MLELQPQASEREAPDACTDSQEHDGDGEGEEMVSYEQRPPVGGGLRDHMDVSERQPKKRERAGQPEKRTAESSVAVSGPIVGQASAYLAGLGVAVERMSGEDGIHKIGLG